jgi:hypothetical protein
MKEHKHRTETPQQHEIRNRPPAAERIEVIAVGFSRGEGCCEHDVYRNCTAYYALDGTLLAVADQWADNNPPNTVNEEDSYLCWKCGKPGAMVSHNVGSMRDTIVGTCRSCSFGYSPRVLTNADLSDES